MARPSTTSQSAIVAAALELLDQSGDEDFSLRTLAERLGVTHAALFRHVTDKNELITLVIDQQLGLALEDVIDEDPMTRLREIGISLREQFDRHPNLLRPLINSSGSGENAQRLASETVSALVKLKVSPDRLAHWLRVFENLVVGSAVFDNAAAPKHLQLRADRLNTLAEVGLIPERLSTEDIKHQNFKAFTEVLDLLLNKLGEEVSGSSNPSK